MPKFPIIIQEKGAKKAEKNIAGLSKKLGGLSKAAMGAAGGLLGAGALVAGLRAATQAAAEQELAEKKLTQALGGSAEALIQQAAALQQSTIFGDEAIIQQQAYLASIGLSEQQIKDMIPVTMDLAAATGMSLESAVKNTAKTLSGMTGELGESVGALKDLTAEELRAGEGIEVMRKMFKGMAETEAKSLHGAMEQTKNAIGDAAETIGSLLSPAVIKVAGFLKTASERASSFFQRMTETSLESSIRELRELGVNTIELELASAKLELARNRMAAVDLEPQLVLSERQEVSVLRQTEATQKLAEQRRILAEAGTTEEKVRSNILANEGRTRNIIISRESRNRIKTIDGLNEEIDSQIVLQGELKKKLDIYSQINTAEDLVKATEEVAHQQRLANSNMENESDKKNIDKKTVRHEKHLAFIQKLEKAVRVDRNNEDNEYVKNVKDGYVALAESTGAYTDAIGTTTSALLAAGDLSKGEQVRALKLLRGVAIAQAAQAIIKGYAQLGPLLGTFAAITTGAATYIQINKINKQLNELQGAQYGMDAIVDKPTLILAGEGNKAESVQITPLEGPNVNGPQSSQTINVSIEGNVLSEQWVEEELSVKISDAVRRGVSFGLN